MQPESGVRTWQWVVTAIVIIVLIVIGIMVFGGKGDKAPTDTDNNATTTPTANTGINSVVILDQYPGNVAYASSVQMSQPGWVVIHKDNKGQPGEIIGQTYVPAGINPAKITLSQPILDGGTYYAMLHSDNGDQKFDAAVDMPLKDKNGNMIMRIFRGSASADQSIKG